VSFGHASDRCLGMRQRIVLQGAFWAWIIPMGMMLFFGRAVHAQTPSGDAVPTPTRILGAKGLVVHVEDLPSRAVGPQRLLRHRPAQHPGVDGTTIEEPLKTTWSLPFSSEALRWPEADENTTALRRLSPLTPVERSDELPWRIHAVLYVRFPTYRPWEYAQCSAVMIGPAIVLTAGHCIYSRDWQTDCHAPPGCWPTSVEVVPGFDRGIRPVGAARGVEYSALSAWTEWGDLDWDIAWVTLDRPVGALSGWAGLGYMEDRFYTNPANRFINAGYPAVAPLYDGRRMWYRTGWFDAVTTHGLRYTPTGVRGMSGAGVWPDGVLDIHGVQSHSVYDGDGNLLYAQMTRFTPFTHRLIVDEVVASTPWGADLVPLAVQVVAEEMAPGDALQGLSYVVTNHGRQSWQGALHADIYVSIDSDIEVTDRYLGSHISTISLAPLESRRIWVDPLPRIPAGQSPGLYWVGVILDVIDGNPWNNATSGWDTTVIRVVAANTPTPTPTPTLIPTIAPPPTPRPGHIRRFVAPLLMSGGSHP
jgi:V8-like Glu-specific endopeptidase